MIHITPCCDGAHMVVIYITPGHIRAIFHEPSSICICGFVSVHFFFKIIEFTQLQLVPVAIALDQKIVEINRKRRWLYIQLKENIIRKENLLHCTRN